MKYRDICLISLAAMVFSSCKPPEVDQVVWEPLDYENITQSLSAPTGLVEATSLSEAYEKLRDLVYLDQAAGMLVALESEDTGEINAALAHHYGASEKGSGTNAYIRIACPGPDMAIPDTEFKHGELRLDGPNITEELVEKWATEGIDGDIYLRFRPTVDDEGVERMCQIGAITIDGHARTYFDRSPFTIILELNVNVENTDSGDTRHLEFKAVLSGFGLEVLWEDSAGETLTISFLFGDAYHLSVTGKDGTYECTLNPEELTGTCTNPVGTSFSFSSQDLL